MISAVKKEILKLPLPCGPLLISISSLKFWPIPPSFCNIQIPEKRKLPAVEKVPQIPPNMKPPRLTKRLVDLRGPELVNNKLFYKQYGIISLCGGYLRHGHFEMMRLTINRKMDVKRMFAVWRVDPPWKPITRRGQGKRLGGGKGAIDHYATPVKAGRIVVEMGGLIEYEEVFPFLQEVVLKLPFDAMVVSQKMLDDLKTEEEELLRRNINPFSFEYCVNNKMGGCHHWVRTFDKIWFNKYI